LWAISLGKGIIFFPIPITAPLPQKGGQAKNTRAGIVERPEDYRWCSMGLRVRNPKRAKKLLTFFSVSQQDEWSDAGLVAKFKTMNTMAWYREFVYLSGGVAREGKASIPGDIIAKVVSYHGKLGLGDCFRYPVRLTN
jgi:hypothetical protein